MRTSDLQQLRDDNAKLRTSIDSLTNTLSSYLQALQDKYIEEKSAPAPDRSEIHVWGHAGTLQSQRDLYLNDLWEDVEFFARGTGHLENRESRCKSTFKPTGKVGWGDTQEEARKEALGI